MVKAMSFGKVIMKGKGKVIMKKKLITIVLAASMALSLVACGGSGNGNGGAANDSQTTAEVASDSSVLNVGVSTAPQNLSPFTNFTNRQPVNQYVYETLMVQDKNGGWLPCVAKSFTTEDNLTYSFEIFDYVKDSAGNEIKAEDCVFSLEHARDEAANTWIDSAKVTGEYTFDLTVTDVSTATLPTAINRAPIVSKASYEASADGMATTPVGTSPYVVTEFVSNVSCNFVKNENYWQTDEQYLSPIAANANVNGMNFIKIAEAAQQTVALETGTIDVFYRIASSEVENFIEGGRNAEKFTSISGATDTGWCLYFGRDSFLSQDENLRKAIMYAINKEEINIGAFGGLLNVPTFYGATDGMSDLTPSTINPDYFNYDEAKVEDYLSKANYNGEEIRLLVPNEDSHNKIAAIVQGQLMKIGLNVKIEAYDNAMFQSAFGEGNGYDMSICQMGLRDNAFVWSFLAYDLTGGSFGAGLKDPQLTELIAKANSIEGHTPEVATEVNDYIIEHAISENLISGTAYTIYRKDLGAIDIPYLSGTYDGERTISATVFSK